jgi:hypothetical protein
MKPQTPTPTPVKVDNKPLSQAEAALVADWLREQGLSVRNSSQLWKLRPSAISNSFKVPALDIVKAARRIEE